MQLKEIHPGQQRQQHMEVRAHKGTNELNREDTLELIINTIESKNTQKCNENINKLNQTGIQMIVALGNLARSVGFVVPARAQTKGIKRQKRY
jgi:dTDP-4-dehydrorhamnose reductase